MNRVFSKTIVDLYTTDLRPFKTLMKILGSPLCTPPNQMRIDTDDFEIPASPSSSVVQIYGQPPKRSNKEKWKRNHNRIPALKRIANIRANRERSKNPKRNDNNLPQKNRTEGPAGRRSSRRKGDEALHFQFLKKEFTDRLGLPVDSGKRRKIYSFDGVQIAEGYEKVVTTWQGMFFQMNGEDIIFENLRKENRRNRNLTIYKTKGVELFKLQMEDRRITPRPHRFAVKPPES